MASNQGVGGSSPSGRASFLSAFESLHKFDGRLIRYSHIQIVTRLELIQILDFLAELERALLSARILNRDAALSWIDRSDFPRPLGGVHLDDYGILALGRHANCAILRYRGIIGITGLVGHHDDLLGGTERHAVSRMELARRPIPGVRYIKTGKRLPDSMYG